MSGGNLGGGWKFDPNTGEPIRDTSAEDVAPSERPFDPVGQGYHAPNTGPLGPEPELPPSDMDVDSFRAPYQAEGSAPVHVTPPGPPPMPGQEQYQAPYQEPYSPPQPPTQPMPMPGYQPQYGYGQAAPPTTNVNIQPRRKSRAPLIIGLIALVLLASLVVGGYFLYQNFINRPPVAVERLVPANTLGYFSFDPVLEGNQKAAMDNVTAAFQAQPGFTQAWNGFTKGLSNLAGGCNAGSEGTPTPGGGANNLDALSSYLGNNVTVAVLPPSTDDLNKLTSGSGGDASDVIGKNVVGIVDLDFNPLDKKGLIGDLKRQADSAGKTGTTETYKNVDIHQFIPSCGALKQVYFALLDNSSTAIVAAKAEPLKVLIDGYRDNKALKDDATFKLLSGQVPSERIASLYLNLTEIYKQVQLAAPQVTQNQSVQNVNGSMLVTLSAANDGLQVDTATETDMSVAGTQVQVNPDAKPDPATLNDVPTGSLAFVVGTDLKDLIKSALDTFRKNDTSGSIDQQIKSFESQTGVSLENDVLPLLDGDYVLSASVDNSNGSLSPSVVFQLKLKDSAKASEVLDKIMASTGADAEQAQVMGSKFYSSRLGGNLVGIAQDRLWVALDLFQTQTAQSAETHLTDAINNLGKGFGTTSDWANAKAHLVRDSNVIGYANLTKVREVVEKQMFGNGGDRSDYDKNYAPFLRPLRYFLLGSATQAAKNGTLSQNHTVLFVGISK